MALSIEATEALRNKLYHLAPDLLPGHVALYQQLRRTYLIAGEGIRYESYDDGKGNITVGVGFNMDLNRSREDWDRVFKGSVSFDAIYQKEKFLTATELELLLEDGLRIRELELKWIYQGVWGKLRANERLAIESAYYNAPSLVMGPSADKASLPPGIKLPPAKQTRFYGHIKRYAETKDHDVLRQAVIELKDLSNYEKDPKIHYGLQQRRNSEAELLASYKEGAFAI